MLSSVIIVLTSASGISSPYERLKYHYRPTSSTEEFSQFGQRLEGGLVDRFELSGDQTLDALEPSQLLLADHVRVQLPDRLRVLHIQRILMFFMLVVSQSAEQRTIDRKTVKIFGPVLMED